MARENRFQLPWWYNAAEWLPLIAGVATAALMAAVLTGYIAVPAALGTLQWLPVLYNSLEGAAASMFALGLGMLSTGLMAWFTTATFTQAWVLYPVLRNMQQHGESLEKNLKSVQDELRQFKTNEQGRFAECYQAIAQLYNFIAGPAEEYFRRAHHSETSSSQRPRPTQ